MKFQFDVEEFTDYLVIKSFGARNSGSDYISGTKEFSKLIFKTNYKYVIADYREVIFNLNHTEAFNIVKIYERKFPDFKDLSMAVVVNPKNREFTSFWEEISQKKGFNFKVFEDMDLAKEWIKEKINSKK